MTYASKNGIIFKKKLLKNNYQKTCICQKLAVLLWCEIVYKKNVPCFATRHIPTIKK